MRLEPVDTNIWTVSLPRKTLGLSLGVRMTVIRLPNGQLFLHSPVELTPSLREELDELGRVRYVICPNKMHHLFAQDYSAVYTSATFYVAPGLKEKRPDLSFAEDLEPTPPAEWMDIISQLFIAGVPRLNETAFFHRPSRSLILTDLLFNLSAANNVWEKAVLSLNGIDGRFASSKLFRMMVKDKEAFRSSIERLLVWQPVRVIMAHGSIHELRGAEELRHAFAGI